MGHPLIIAVIAIVVIVGGGIFAWQSGLIDLDSFGSGDTVTEEPEVQEETETLTEEEEEFVACPAVCVPMWRFNSVTNECTFTECGSGCGPDNVETFETQAQCEVNVVVEEIEEEAGTEIEGKGFTVEEAKEQVRLCETNDDCKIQAIGCNGCDCGRAVNNWVESVCTGEEVNACPALVCPPSEAVCNAGVCEKVDL